MITPVLPLELDEALRGRILDALARMIAERILERLTDDARVE